MKAQRTVIRDLTPLAASYGLKLQLHDTRSKHTRLEVIHPSGVSRDLMLTVSGRSDSQSQANFARQGLQRLIKAEGWSLMAVAPSAATAPSPPTPVRLAAHSGPAKDVSTTKAIPAPTEDTPPMTEESPARSKRHVLTYLQRKALDEFVTPSIIDHGDGTCDWVDNQTDATVAADATKMLGWLVTKGHVTSLRQGVWGPTRRLRANRPSAKNGDQALADRIQKLEEAFCTLVDRLGENPNQLDCAALLDHLAEGE